MLLSNRRSGTRQVTGQSVPEWLLEAYNRQIQQTKDTISVQVLSESATVNISQETAKCMASLLLPENPPPSALVCLPQGEDPITGRKFATSVE